MAGAAEPVRGVVGVGTWATQAEFKDIKVTKGERTLYASDFSKGLQGWQTLHGNWEVVNGALRQTSRDDDARALIGDPSWHDYTLSLQARKLGGDEGFLILFGLPTAKSDAMSWWNLGGWNNSAHALQVPGVAVQQTPGKIENNRWYAIRVELSGSTIRTFLDNQLVQTATLPSDEAAQRDFPIPLSLILWRMRA